MLAAGWSTRVSYRMVDTYASVLRCANAMGFDNVAGLTDSKARALVGPLGLTETRLTYLRSLTESLAHWEKCGTDPVTMEPKAFIREYRSRVRGASFKVAQCAAL